MSLLNKKLRNKAFFSEFEKPITEEGHVYYKISSRIFKKNNLSNEIVSVEPLGGSGNYDTFKITGKSNDFILKISLDDQDPLLLNECLFYKNNKDDTLCSLIDSGVIKVGDNVMFLLLEDNLGYNLHETGKNFIIDNVENLSHNMLNQCKFIATNTFCDYIESIKDLNSLDNLGEQTILSIKNYQDVENLDLMIKEVNDILDSCKLKESSYCFDFCHGNLNAENLTSLNGLYKFCDFDHCFYGNQFIDIGILCFNLGYKEVDFNHIVRSHCKASGFDYELKKEEARDCLDSAFYIFFSRLIFEFIIEQCIYRNAREENIISLTQRFDESLWFFEKSKFSQGFKNTLKSIFDEPVDFDKDLRSKYS